MTQLDDPEFRASLQSASDLASASGHALPTAHEAVLDAIAGAEPTAAERRLWKTLSPMAFPTAPAMTAILLCGRRWGKSYVCAMQLLFDALVGRHGEHTLPNQRLYYAIVCPELRQSRESARAIEHWAGVLAPLGLELERRDADGHVEFSIVRPRLEAVPVLTIFTASATSFRGYPLAGLVLDEAGHFPFDEGNPSSAREILLAAKPGMLTFQGKARVILAGTPGAASGLHYDWSTKPPRGSLFVRAPSWSSGFVTRERCEADAVDFRHFQSEYEVSRFGARDEQALERFQIRACVNEEKIAARPAVAARVIALDYAARRDSTSLCVARLEYGESASGESMPTPIVICEYVSEHRGTPDRPILVEHVVDKIVALRRSFKGVVDVQFDMHAAPEFHSALRKIGVKTTEVSMAPREQTMRWLSLFTLVRSKRIAFPDREMIIDQLASLRMTELAGGSLRIEGKSKARDDVADAICIAAWRALSLQPSGGSIVCVREPIRMMTEGPMGGGRKWYRRTPNGQLVPATPPVGTSEHRAWIKRMQEQGLSTPAMEKFLATQDKE